ncbi:glycerol-3-phosphate dehydrogenase/oxidase [Euzebya tangerina]|uniref:glycerol-3-phosphate dehydrogenase/oxidase n=1 Tax=Euzebya tangerina TaxID=591198 RepID=UPI000E31E2E2|nr:glycerol-3-phosphate dehydrogenase/oxidase [Euzebya tangerina]
MSATAASATTPSHFNLNATPQGQLSPEYRRESIRRLAEEEFDILVVGGGVTGTGTALDAASRGLRVGLVEARDFASGTSSRSSKMFHGGLRYLEQFDFGLVFEALHERTLMIERLCPHLVNKIPFLYPLTHRVWERAYVGAGIGLYDVMAGLKTGMPRHRHLSRKKTLQKAPSLRADSLVGAIQYYDAQVDDARHTLALARTAAKFGAAVASSARVVDFAQEGERVVGARVRDLEGGTEFTVNAGQVINATGVWTDDLQQFVGRGQIKVQASKGVHIVVPSDRIHSDSGFITQTATSVLFIIPWMAPPYTRHWIIGTTDTPWELDKAHPAASAADIDYILDEANKWLNVPLTKADVEGVYAGLRPLLKGESEATSQLSREHAVVQGVSGLITVAGGKYTTYRVMAKDAVDAAVRSINRKVPETPTADLPLVGAEGYQVLWNQREQLAQHSGLHLTRIEHLLRRYGVETRKLLAEIDERPELATPIDGADEYLLVEAWYAAAWEGALHMDDILTRRTRISIETFDRGVAAANQIAPIVGEVLGWSEEDRAREIDHYTKRVEAERESQTQADDLTADAARLGAPDVRIGFAGS